MNYGDLITNIIVLVGTKRKWVTKKLKEELKNFPSLSKPIGSTKVNAKRGKINLNLEWHRVGNVVLFLFKMDRCGLVKKEMKDLTC